MTTKWDELKALFDGAVFQEFDEHNIILKAVNGTEIYISTDYEPFLTIGNGKELITLDHHNYPVKPNAAN
jgi:hypothetical protein